MRYFEDIIFILNKTDTLLFNEGFYYTIEIKGMTPANISIKKINIIINIRNHALK